MGNMQFKVYPRRNCTVKSNPNAVQFFEDVVQHPLMLFIIILCTLATIVTIALLVESVYHVGKKVPRSGVANHRMNTCWMLALYPMFCLVHLPGVWIPSAASFCITVGTLIYSFILVKFLTLLVDYYGGHRKMMIKIRTTEVMFPLTVAPLTACCCCLGNNLLREKRLTKRSLLILRIVVLQVALIRPVINFVIALFSFGNIERWDSPVTGMTMIMVVSTLSAMTALNMLYTGSAKSLSKYNIRPKFYLIKMGMIIGNLQMAIFRVLSNFWIFDCFLQLPFETRAAFWQCISVTAESFFLFLLSRSFYRNKKGNVVGKPLPTQDILGQEGDIGRAMKMRNWIRRHSWRRHTFG